MSVVIEQIRPASSDEWDVIWRDCSYATYFHSREWAEIWSHYSQAWMRPNPLLVLFSDGKEALLPLSCEMSGGSVKSFWSSPEGTYGGWIAVDPIGREHAILMTEFLTKELGPLWWQTNPYDDLVAATGVDTNIEDETHVINLERGFDIVYRNWAHQCRNSERKARRSGVRVKLAQKEGEWRDYYQAYEDTLCRWGEQAKSRYRWTLFHEMFSRQSDHVRLWLSTVKDDLVVAGVLVCYARAHVAAWHSAALKAYLTLRPMNLLYYEIMRHACEAGYQWFDLGSSAGLEGVQRFKKTFGAKPLDCPIVYIPSQSTA